MKMETYIERISTLVAVQVHDQITYEVFNQANAQVDDQVSGVIKDRLTMWIYTRLLHQLKVHISTECRERSNIKKRKSK